MTAVAFEPTHWPNASSNAHLLRREPHVLRPAVDLVGMHRQKQAPVRFVEYWRWRYLDPKTGRTCRTSFQMSADEAASTLVDAEPIPGTMLLREVQDDGFAPTGPDVRVAALSVEGSGDPGATDGA